MVLALLLSFFSNAQASFDVPALRQEFNTPAVHSGPNCYNTSLIALGYMDEVIHVSPQEADFYFNKFCKTQNVPPESAPNGSIVTYSSGGDLKHVAAFLGNSLVLEKYNILGSETASSDVKDGFHGDYLIHPLADSYYFNHFPKNEMTVLHCAPAAEVQLAMSQLKQGNFAERLLKQRKELARNLAALGPHQAGEFLARFAVIHLQDILEILKALPKAPEDHDFVLALALSNYHEIYYLSKYSDQNQNPKIIAMIQQIEDLLSKTDF